MEASFLPALHPAPARERVAAMQDDPPAPGSELDELIRLLTSGAAFQSALHPRRQRLQPSLLAFLR